MADNFPTARSMLPQDGWLCLLVWCKACSGSIPVRRAGAVLRVVDDEAASLGFKR